MKMDGAGCKRGRGHYEHMKGLSICQLEEAGKRKGGGGRHMMHGGPALRRPDGPRQAGPNMRERGTS